MVRRDGAEVRRERILEMGKRVFALLQKHSGEIPFGKTVSLLEAETGLTREKIVQYLRIHEALERFVIDVEKDRICKVPTEEETLNE